jgi:hypothetical protein
MFVEEVDNPETRATLGTRHRTKPKNTKYTTQNTKTMSNTTPLKTEANPCELSRNYMMVNFNNNR